MAGFALGFRFALRARFGFVLGKSHHGDRQCGFAQTRGRSSAAFLRLRRPIQTCPHLSQRNPVTVIWIVPTPYEYVRMRTAVKKQRKTGPITDMSDQHTITSL